MDVLGLANDCEDCGPDERRPARVQIGDRLQQEGDDDPPGDVDSPPEELPVGDLVLVDLIHHLVKVLNPPYNKAVLKIRA